ncbi:MAG: peptidylprolyl isomerase [Candidatus Poseidoniaceae archaeon]|nr:peptidylprolyl isomerase [Candidatus Poseidoniaceae archaeon]
MKGRLALLLVVNLLLMSCGTVGTAIADEQQPAWRSVGIDPTQWTDGPVEEDTPMKNTYQGNAVFEIEVSYIPSLGSSRQSGTITLELFEQWAPITTANMIKNVESGIYDGIFFHRVIDDFVTQSGDPTCKSVFGFYPLTSLECGTGGTGTTIPLEHEDNLSHVDGAIGMARGQEEDSADSQWYIAETEAHNLDPENRDDGGYATFGIVRNGMSHVRNIAKSPTSDDPTGNEDIQNPASSAGRPVNEILITSVTLTGVSDPDGTVRFGPQDSADEGGFFALVEEFYAVIFTSTFLIGVFVVLAGWMFARIDTPLSIENQNKEVSLDALLLDEKP